MNLPHIISRLVKAQNIFDSNAYAACFTENAVVHDEGKTHHGRTEVAVWIEKANKEYQAQMEPLDYNEQENRLSAKISGIFPGSPLVLQYHLELSNGLIQSLRITG